MNIYVVGYSVFMGLMFLVYYKYKKSRFDIGALLLLVWFIASIMSVLIYHSIPYYEYDNISLLPYLYLVILLVLSFYPFLIFNESNIKCVRGDDRLLYNISLLIIVISVLPFIENLLQVIKIFFGGNNTYYIDVYELRGDEQEVRTWLSFIGRKLNSIALLMYLFMPILLFYWLTKERVKWWLIIGLSVSVLNVSLYSLAVATRVSLWSQMVYMFYLYLLFNCVINKRIKRSIKKYGLIFVFIVSLFFLAISISRFDNKFQGNVDYDMYGWFAIYGGESTLRFNAFMWDLRNYMGGDNSFSFFKELMGMKTFANINDRRYYWYGPTGIDQNVFYTYIGDIYGDFGPFFVPIIILLVVSIVKLKKKKDYELYELIPYSIWFYVCVFGFMYYPFKTYFANKALIFNILIYFVIRFFSRIRIKGNKV